MYSHIAQIAYHLPEKTLTNDELSSLYPEWSAERIFEKTGIRERRVSAAGETALDLAEQACAKLLREGGVDKGTIDFLLLCTQSPDYYLPTSACLLQARLGLARSCGALDFNLGCSGFVYGLSLAKGLIAGGVAKRVLLATAETYSKLIHPMDKSVRTIFGDAAAATLVDGGGALGIGEFALGTDGAEPAHVIVPAGAMRRPRSGETGLAREDESGNVRSDDNIFMNGPEIFNFTLDVVPETLERTLALNGLAKQDVDLFVFHQANVFMLTALRRAIKIPEDKFFVDIADIGNTVSSSIPIALARAEAKGRLKAGMKVMVVGFGVGLSWGATVLTWTKKGDAQ
jgi:3-oxoacyl-[acyl-carrier-protein] synthase-3